MRSAYHTNPGGTKVVFINPLFEYGETIRLRRLRLATIACGGLSLIFIAIAVLSLLVA